MTIKPRIRNNIALNANPEGCERNIKNQIDSIKDLPPLTDKPLNVLIIGGSSGYGLSTRIALTYKANAYTYNLSYESAPSGNRSGTAGYYNNLYFKEISKKDGFESDDTLGDAFSDEAKMKVIEDFKASRRKIDLLVYSVASGVRVDPLDGIKYMSALKPIGDSYSGYNVDIIKKSISPMTLQSATEEEIAHTVKVMGGEDYLRWAQFISEAGLFNQGAQCVTYTYFGSAITDPIYRYGTIGNAKRDLESKNQEVHELMSKVQGRALISASKAVVTKASVFIPTMALYVSALFKVMKKHNTHESVIEHKYRLYKDMIFNKDMTLSDDLLVRPDAYELDDSIQQEVKEILDQVTPDNFGDLVEFDCFIEEFLEINGFMLDDLNDI